MSNTLTYSIELTPENASKIDQINKILLGESYTEEHKMDEPNKTSAKKAAPAKKAEPEEESTGLTLEDIRTAAKKAKSEFGEEFTMQVLKDADVDVKATLGRSMSAIPEEQYEDVIAAWQAGPQESDDLEDDDLEDDLEEDEGEVDAEAVKTALKAYSKEHGRDEAKAIMTKHKVKALSGVDDLKPAALAKLMKELV